MKNKTVDMKFHCLNVINMYNFGMGLVDVADKLRMQYRPANLMHNRKWWWSIFIWGLGGAAKNHASYMTGSSPRCPLRSHSLVCIENQLFIVGIGPIINKELEFTYLSDRSDRKYVYS